MPGPSDATSKFGLDPFTLAVGGLSAIPSIISGFDQRAKANRLKLSDSTTPEEREALGMSRQAAATSRLPGMGAMQARLGMGMAGAVQNARLGAGSSSDFLASAGAADARRQQGEADLSMKGLAYQDQSNRQLRADLTTASNRRQHDLDTFNNQKAALTQGYATNLNNGVQTLGSYGALARNTYLGKTAPPAPAPSGVPTQGYNQPGTGYDDDLLPGMGGFGRLGSRYRMGR